MSSAGPLQVLDTAAPGRDVTAAIDPLRPPPIDPLRSWPGGRYDDGVVIVEAGCTPGIIARLLPDGRIAVRHRLRPAEFDDELGGALAAVLAPLTDDNEVFARAFTGIVLTSEQQAGVAWERFYRTSLERIGNRGNPGYSAVYRHAISLLPSTSVLDLGCSFGFLAMHLADRGVAVTACDIEPGTTGLVRAMARRLHHDLEVVTARNGLVPLRSQSRDAVAVLHVLEHLDPAGAATVLGEALRIARRRVVVAVPYEDRPNALFGHVRSLDADCLGALGAATGWQYEIHEHHGGWLVLDRTSPPPHSSDRVSAPHEGKLQ